MTTTATAPTKPLLQEIGEMVLAKDPKISEILPASLSPKQITKLVESGYALCVADYLMSTNSPDHFMNAYQKHQATWELTLEKVTINKIVSKVFRDKGWQKHYT